MSDFLIEYKGDLSTEIIHTKSGSKSELKIGALENRPTEIWRMSANNVKARDELGWSSAIGLEEGLEKTIEWYRVYVDEFYNSDSRLNKL